MIDAKVRRRNAHGERGGMAKFSDADIEGVRSAAGTNVAIAARFGISASYVSRLRRGIRRQGKTHNPSAGKINTTAVRIEA